MSGTLAQLKRDVSNHMSLTLEAEGFSPLVGKIFTVLLFAEQPASLQDIAQQLGVSKAAVSVQIRLMERGKWCSKIAVHNDRKDYYAINEQYGMTAYRLIVDKMLAGQQFIRETLATVAELEQASGVAAEALTFQRRMAKLSDMLGVLLEALRQAERDWNERYIK